MTDQQFNRVVRRATTACDLWIKVALIAAALYFALSVAPAFFPGGAVDRIAHGGVR